MRKIHLPLTCIILTFLIITGCAPKKQVQRVDVSTQTDLSGRWNDTDSRLVAQELVRQVLGDHWIYTYKQLNPGQRPIVIVGLVRNKTHEHISSDTFIKEIEKSLIKSGEVRLVQAHEKREDLRKERAEQQDFASPETAKNWGMELGADFMLQGTINSIVDATKRERMIYYQVNLELAHLETNEIVWIGEKKIKKLLKN